MSREAYNQEARAIIARVQAEGAADMRAMLAKQEQRLRDAVNAMASSARKNGVAANAQGFVLPDVRQVLSMARPNVVFNITP